MTSNFNPKQSVPNASAGHNPQTAPGAYSPSVPISLYRELAAELQATKVMLDSLNNQNQQITQQNQQLRREIEKVVHASLHLQQIADSSVPSGWSQPSYTHPELRNEPGRSIPEAPQMPRRTRSVSNATPSAPGVDISTIFQEMESIDSGLPAKLVIEQPETRNRRRSGPEKSSEVNGWWLTLAIVMIVVTAFGAGYLIMRPMLPKR
ncbi:hypothetical protein [Argonema galeatum]|uniref:hypothetical protein n=1 Tax=Argonema galeatum TaxID=2942762 RepID=UPI0020116F00|nr:hypothetical protein [Argonema galeatum]MCL1468327.1 hypothetical protein [Argonema galeatum A003/A1]